MKKNYFLLSFLFGFFSECSQNIQAQQNVNELTIEQIWGSNEFEAKSVWGLSSMNDGRHYTSFVLDIKNKDVYILKYQYQTGNAVDTLLKKSWLKIPGLSNTPEIENYQFNHDESKMLIATDVEQIYRYSSKEINYIWDVKTKSLEKLTDKGKQMYAAFSPDGKKAAYVINNNLFIKDLITKKEIQITKDGEMNKIINGASDWVYEEEFELIEAFFWSPDGNKIAFYRFDESEVKEFSMTMYDALYPSEYKFKYPKAGEKNSSISIHVYDLISKSTITLDIGDEKEKDIYIPRIKWTNNLNILCIQKMNRHQNKLELILADATTGKCDVMLTETNKSYIDITDNLTFLKDNKHFIFTSEKSGYNHIYLYSMKGELVRQITTGSWDVTEFMGIDEKTKKMFYVSAEISPLERHLYTINLDGTGKKKLTSKKGYNHCDFSKNMTYYINYHSDANTPTFVTLHDASGKQIRILEDNAKLIKKLNQYSLSKREFFSFTTSAGVQLNGWMLKPPDFNPDKKYPVFMTVYGGPGSQTVTDSWGAQKHLWYQYIAQKGYIVVSVDNRGTGARGETFKKITYQQLGKYETIDQIEAAKYLGTLSYVDKNRIGIQGWSYGGYMTSLCMTIGCEYFKMGIAVAPVTSWRFYDSIYTERYMRTPQENPSGYDDNSPLFHAERLKGKYLLIHGTADDNVHLQNSIEWINALVLANKKYDSEFYPNNNHAIHDNNAHLHVHERMTAYILENL